ncbi:Glu-tRNA(Gln) amidotransferase GatDE subunit D, partial [Candidatus Pacearchaeota archaeon]
LHTSRRDAFKSVNALPVAKLTPQKVEFISKPKLRTGENPALDVEHTDKVALVKYFPGQNPDVLDFYSMTCKGIVIEAMGLGHLPTEEATNNWIPKVKRVIKEGRVICITSQCIHGRVDPYVYSAGRALEKTGAIFLDDMLPETALVKLGWVLGHYGWKSKVREKMLTNFAGELNHRLVPELGN